MARMAAERGARINLVEPGNPTDNPKEAFAGTKPKASAREPRTFQEPRHPVKPAL